MHENTGEGNYNESAYYNFYDPKIRLGGFVRIGNRPNEHYAEMTCCLYLPDGRVGFMFARPKIADNAKFDAAGCDSSWTHRCGVTRSATRGASVCSRAPLDLLEPEGGVHVEPARAGAGGARLRRTLARVRR
jgi:hypothetical protein